MAVVQISRIQHRRGLQQDFPQLASAELGWSLDQRRLFIGNGTVEEGAPSTGVTEILTEYSDVLALSRSYTFKGLLAGFVVQTGPDANNPVIRTLQDKLDDFVSVRDFGAIGDGVADDTAAIQRALDNPLGTATAGGQNSLFHRTVYFPAGDYLISDTIQVPPFTRLQGEGKTTSTLIARVIFHAKKQSLPTNFMLINWAQVLVFNLAILLPMSTMKIYSPMIQRMIRQFRPLIY